MDKEEESNLDLIADIAALVLSENEGEATNALVILRRKAQQSDTSGGSLKRIWRRFAERGDRGVDPRDGSPEEREASDELHARLRRDLAAVRQNEQRLTATVARLSAKVERANSRFKFATFCGISAVVALVLTLALSDGGPMPPPEGSLEAAAAPVATAPPTVSERQPAREDTAARAAGRTSVLPERPALASASSQDEAAGAAHPGVGTSGVGAAGDGADGSAARPAVGDVDHAEPEIGNLPPEYPADAARRGEQGVVLLRVAVSADGGVSRVDVARSSGFATLDRAASDRILMWRFRPATRNGRPVSEVVEQQIRFNARS